MYQKRKKKKKGKRKKLLSVTDFYFNSIVVREQTLYDLRPWFYGPEYGLS